MNFFKKVKGSKDSGGTARKISMQDVLDNLSLMEEAEKSVSEFYLLCADSFPENKDFWLSMAASELRHAENVRKMSALIGKDPKKYHPGYAFQPATIRAFGLYLDGLVEKLRSGEIPRDQILSVASDIEDSAVELHYGDIVETRVDEFNLLAREIDSETEEHKGFLAATIRNSQGD